MFQSFIYFDNNSTTKLDIQVLGKMLPYYLESYANTNSSHVYASLIKDKVEYTKEKVSEIISAQSKEVIFTSGSTEAINIAIKGIAESYIDKGKHIITCRTEHLAVLNTCKYLETKGYEITYLDVDKDGLIDLEDLKNKIRNDTILVSIMLVNNETGVIQPIKEISEIVHKAKSIFMTDATQAVGKIPVNVKEMGIDLLCMSAHKMYGPKGIGALYIRNGSKKVNIPPFIHGGGQENGIRSGTLNVPGIIAFGKACEIAKDELTVNAHRIGALRDKLENHLLDIDNSFVNGSKKRRIYNTTNICFRGIEANALIGRLKTIAVSNGSACSSSVLKPSHVLTSMGLNEDDAFASIRFSLGKYNTIEEIQTAVTIIKKEIEILKRLNK
jgi:cysteine desulfurase